MEVGGRRPEGRSSRRREGAASGLYEPRAVQVRRGGSSAPESVDGRRVEAIREEWLVEDRWWTNRPLRRHYLELVLAGGRCTVVFCDLTSGSWFEQR